MSPNPRKLQRSQRPLRLQGPSIKMRMALHVNSRSTLASSRSMASQSDALDANMCNATWGLEEHTPAGVASAYMS